MNPLSNALLTGLGGGAGSRASGSPPASISGLGASSQFAAMLRSGSPPAPPPMAAPTPSPMPSAAKPAQPPRPPASASPSRPGAAAAQEAGANAAKSAEANERLARHRQACAREDRPADQAEPTQTNVSEKDALAAADFQPPAEVEADAGTELAADAQDGAKDVSKDAGKDAAPANPLVSLQQLPTPDALPDSLAAGTTGPYATALHEAATSHGAADTAEARARVDVAGAAGAANAAPAADAQAGQLAEKAELLRSADTALPDGETGGSHAVVTATASPGAFDAMLGAAAAPHARPVHAGTTGASAAMPARVDLPQPLYSSGFAPEMAARLSVMAADGVQHARLHLNPAEMGPVAVQILVDGQQAQIAFHSDQAETRAVLERSLPELAAALRDSGLTLSGGGVFQQARDPGQGGQGQAQTAHGSQRSLGGQTGGEALTPEVAAVPAARSRGVVDLYA